MNPNNTVSAVHQTGTENVFGLNGSAHPRILFVGNSITLHFPNADLGWHNLCGMAASAPENDYVHLVMAAVKERYPQADHTIVQQADWERAYWKNEEILKSSEAAAGWQPDVVILRIGENTAVEPLKTYDYTDSLVHLARFYGGERARYIVTDEFWKCDAKDVHLEKAAALLGAAFVTIKDLGQDVTNTADGLFAHKGVACHPGDRGMRGIADRILEKLLPLLAEISK